MIERASTCLEAGGRQFLRTAKPSLRNRRTLHTKFWHHGASELCLPIWWASVSNPEPPRGDEDGPGKACAQESQSYDGQLLDFLYPQKALAFIQQLSRHSNDGVEARRKHGLAGAGVRHFSTTTTTTTTWKADESVAQRTAVEEMDSHQEKNLRDIKIQAELEERLANGSARDALRDIFLLEEEGKQELAWCLYTVVPDVDRTADLQVDLLDYLSTGGTSVLPNDLLHVFDAIPRPERRASSYRAAISAYIALEMIGPAVALYEEAVLTEPNGEIGTDMLLASAVHDNQWALALRVMKAYRTIPPRATYSYSDTPYHHAAWRKVAKLPYLRGHLQSFVLHTDQFWHEISRNDIERNAVQHLLFGLTAEATKQVLNAQPVDEDNIWDFLMGFFRHLDYKGYRTSFLYEDVIKRMLQMERYREYTNERKPVLALYRLYRNRCETLLKNSTWARPPKPSRGLLRQLLLQQCRLGSEVGVVNLIKDHRIFWPDQHFHYFALKLIINFYAELGRVDEVHKYFEEYQKSIKEGLPDDLKEKEAFKRYQESRGEGLDLSIVSALAYAYARRADVKGTEEQFLRISQEFGLTPNIVSWNILLLAYVRADDLCGALACFEKLIATGPSPDIYTFNTLLSLCAARGDVEAFQILWRRAQELNVNVRGDKYARDGFVQALLNFGDAEGAEATAHTVLADHKSGVLPGSLTHAFNLLLHHYALNADLEGSRRIYRQMVEHKIPMDSWTYGGLMRALIEVKQTNAAYKILRVTMPANGIRVSAFHYAIVITGFVKEGQLAHAMLANRRMHNRNIPQTASSRMASMTAIGYAELQALKEKGDTDPRKRLEALERKMRDVLLSGYETDHVHRQPSHRYMIGTKQDVPEDYFGLVISLYGARGAIDICKEMFEAASIAREDQSDYEAPVGLLTAIMNTHLRAGEHDEVAKCWHLARAQAGKLVKTLENTMKPQPTLKVDDMQLTDPQIVDHATTVSIAKNRRQILFKATRIYIRSLTEQNTAESLQQAGRIFKELLTSGFVIDNRTWNEYIQALARHGQLFSAFSACETYLMPQFPGWRNLKPSYIRRERDGFLWMELRHDDITKRSMMPRYKTLVILAQAWAQVRKDEANGIGYNPEKGGWTREILENLSPKTVRAIETMPRTGDRLQKEYLEGSM